MILLFMLVCFRFLWLLLSGLIELVHDHRIGRIFITHNSDQLLTSRFYPLHPFGDEIVLRSALSKVIKTYQLTCTLYQ